MDPGRNRHYKLGLGPGSTWWLFLACSAAFITQRIRMNGMLSRYLKRITGGVFVGLGIKLALARAE